MKRLIASLAAVGLIAAPAVATAHAKAANAKMTKSEKSAKIAGAKLTKAAAKTKKSS